MSDHRVIFYCSKTIWNKALGPQMCTVLVIHFTPGAPPEHQKRPMGPNVVWHRIYVGEHWADFFAFDKQRSYGSLWAPDVWRLYMSLFLSNHLILQFKSQRNFLCWPNYESGTLAGVQLEPGKSNCVYHVPQQDQITTFLLTSILLKISQNSH